MNFEFEKYTIDELVEMKSLLSSYIHNYKDGYEYLCKVRSYGRVWTEQVYNPQSLQEICWDWNGDNGIVDVYTTNPNLPKIENYGEVNYIKSLDDYNKWYEYTNLLNSINNITEELDEWENNNNLPFNKRSYFEPIYSRKDLEDMKRNLIKFDTNFSEPISYLSLWHNTTD